MSTKKILYILISDMNYRKVVGRGIRALLVPNIVRQDISFVLPLLSSLYNTKGKQHHSSQKKLFFKSGQSYLRLTWDDRTRNLQSASGEKKEKKGIIVSNTVHRPRNTKNTCLFYLRFRTMPMFSCYFVFMETAWESQPLIVLVGTVLRITVSEGLG